PQALDGSPACRSQALHTSRVLYPHEVILPVLRAWIKQGHYGTSDRIQSRSSPGFTEVAGGTGQAQILWSVAPVGINVLNVHRLTDRVTARLAVFAVILRALMD